MNDVIKFLLYFISIGCMALSLLYAYSRVNEKKIVINKKFVIIVSIMSLISLYNNFYSQSNLKIIIAFLITFIMEKLIFNDNNKDTLFTVSLLTVFSIGLEIIISIANSLFVNDLTSLNQNIVVKISLSIIHSSLVYLVFRFTKIDIFINKIKEIIINFVNFYNMMALIIFSLNIIIYFRCFDFNKIAVFIISLISILLLILCLRTIINDKYNNKILKSHNKSLKESYNAYSNTIEECRELKHNLNNDLYTLKSYLPQKYHNHINTILKKYNKDYEWITKIESIPEGLQGLIFLKKNEAKKKHIDLIISSNKKIEIYNEDYIDICSIVGILIDNALEACVNAKGKVIEIKINYINNKLIITILNKFSNQIDLNKIGNKNYSTKKLKSGLGIDFIKKIKNNKIKTKYKIVDNLFISEVNYEQSKKVSRKD